MELFFLFLEFGIDMISARKELVGGAMRKSFHFVFGLVSLALVSPFSAAWAGSLIPVVPYPGSIWTDPFDINDKNVIAGAYALPDDSAHAFFGALDGQYTSFDGDNYAGYTQANGINKDGWITGINRNFDICPIYNCQFVRKPDGTLVTLMKNGVPLDGYPRQITNKAKFVGDYRDSPSNCHSYLGKSDAFQKNLKLDLDRPCARGINNLGVIVGRFRNADGNQSGFILQNGVISTIDYPDIGAVNTQLYGINDSGLASGSWDTGPPDYISHGFTLDTSTNTFRRFDIQGAQAYTFLNGINNAGYFVARSDAGNFIYCPKKKSKCPGATLQAGFGPAIRVSPEWQLMRHRMHRSGSPSAKPPGFDSDRASRPRVTADRH